MKPTRHGTECRVDNLWLSLAVDAQNLVVINAWGHGFPTTTGNLGQTRIVSRGLAGQRGEVIVAICRPSKNAALRYQREESPHTNVVYSTVKRGAGEVGYGSSRTTCFHAGERTMSGRLCLKGRGPCAARPSSSPCCSPWSPPAAQLLSPRSRPTSRLSLPRRSLSHTHAGRRPGRCHATTANW